MLPLAVNVRSMYSANMTIMKLASHLAGFEGEFDYHGLNLFSLIMSIASFFFLARPQRLIRTLAVKNVWRWATGPTSAKGRGNMCTGIPGLKS